MFIQTENAEETLVQSLLLGKAEITGRYCLHIKGDGFSGADFAAMPDLIIRWLGQGGGRILICEDKDIFAFSPNLTPALFETFREKFFQKFENAIVGESKITWFYDMTLSGPALTAMARAKLEAKVKARKEQDIKKQEEIKNALKKSIMDMPMNPDLVASVDKRRKARAMIEVLVVEDDPFSRRLIGGSLSALYHATFAEDGRSALTSYLNRAPDVVFLDIDLPDVSGQDILQKIISFDPDAHIVMLSGNSHSDNVVSAIKAGAKGFVGKPFAKERLIQSIKKCAKAQSATPNTGDK